MLAKLILLFLFMVFSSQNIFANTLLSGKLYYAVSNRIIKVDLISKKKEIFFEARHYILFNYASIFETNKIIFEVLSADRGYPIQFFDLGNKQFESLAEGYKPTYIKSTNTLFYYKYKNKKDTVGLYMMKLDDDRKEVLIAEKTRKQNLEPGKSFYVNIVYPVVSISNNEIIFINIDRELEIYNYQDNKFKKTGIKNLIPFVWRSKTNSLICKLIDSKDYYEVDIRTAVTKKIPNLTRVTDNLIYIPEYDCLIYSKYRWFSFAERADIYVHWLSNNNKEEKLWSDDRIMSGVWVNN